MEKEVSRLLKTILLLFFIGISIQRYLLNSDLHYEIAIVMIVPITIITLLLIIDITHPDDSMYKTVIRRLLIWTIVISIILFMLCSYFIKLSKVYRQ